MTDAVSSSGTMPTFRMPPPPRQQEGSETGSTKTSTNANSVDQQWKPGADGNPPEGVEAPEGFEGFEGKFPNFGGGNMGPGMMPPFGQRETFL
jgi:hypothetical protein